MESDENKWRDAPEGQSAAPVESGHAGYARSPVREQTARVKQRAREKGEEIKETAERKAGELKDTATRRTDEFTSRIGNRIGAVGRALRQAGDGLRNEGEESVARFTDDAAMQVERFGSYLDGRGPEEMMADIRQRARNNPTAFVVGTFALGLVLGRFLRADDGDLDREDAWDSGADERQRPRREPIEVMEGDEVWESAEWEELR